jgi:hypothetical protein
MHLYKNWKKKYEKDQKRYTFLLISDCVEKTYNFYLLCFLSNTFPYLFLFFRFPFSSISIYFTFFFICLFFKHFGLC